MYFVFYTDRLVKSWAAGTTYGPFVFIRPQYKNDIGLLEHELVHVNQFWRTLGLMELLYEFSAKYRFKYEVEAYKKQLNYYPDDRTRLFAQFLVDRYGLGITFDEALAELKK
jgi:hypothetical protein